MKLFATAIALILTLSLLPAQTDSTNAAPQAPTAPVPKPVRKPAVVSSKPVKVSPNLPDTRNAGWEKRALSNIAKGQAGAASIQLIFDGDSITDFWQTRGQPIWKDRYGKFNAIDFAISGDRTQNVLWRLAHGQAQGLHPKLIVLMIGTNNTNDVSTPQEIADGVKEIINEYQKLCPDAVVLLQAVFPRAAAPTDPYRLKVNAINDIISKFGDGTKVIYIDFGNKFLTPDGTLTKDIMPDFLHPSPKGYQIWADAIQPTIDKYLSPK
jgi:lysophospholipase L1-like esterase